MAVRVRPPPSLPAHGAKSYLVIDLHICTRSNHRFERQLKLQLSNSFALQRNVIFSVLIAYSFRSSDAFQFLSLVSRLCFERPTPLPSFPSSSVSSAPLNGGGRTGNCLSPSRSLRPLALSPGPAPGFTAGKLNRYSSSRKSLMKASDLSPLPLSLPRSSRSFQRSTDIKGAVCAVHLDCLRLLCQREGRRRATGKEWITLFVAEI